MARRVELPDAARCVIIGGGVGGTSIAYHLVQLGWDDVVLLERSQLTSGSTFHSAGLVGQLRGSVSLTKMMMYSVELYRRLADEYFETERYADFCASRLSHVDEMVYDWVRSPDFDALLLDTVRATYPEHEHDRFIAHFRGLIQAWLRDQAGTS